MKLNYILAVACALTTSVTAAPPNLLVNAGFEENFVTNMSPDNAHYRPLFERGVALPVGEAVAMPVKVYPNPADGWLGASNRFEYVTGTAGREVHTGTHAVRIESFTVHSAITVGNSISVVEGVGLDDRAVPAGQPLQFSFWAKGQGTVCVSCYMYGQKHENLYDHAKLRAVTPGQLTVADDARWQRFAGTLTIREATVNYFVLVIAVQGRVTLDDLELRARE
jgi:hypothetical protein